MVFDPMIVKNANEINRIAQDRRGLPWTSCLTPEGVMSKLGLTELYHNVRTRAGWYSRLSSHFEPKEMDFLAGLDAFYPGFMREMEKAWRSALPRMKRPEVDASWARGRRKEFLEEQLALTKKALMDLRLEKGRLVRGGDDASAAFLGFFEADAAAEAHNFKAQLARIEAPQDETVERLSEETIQRAREVRLATVLGLDEKKRMACPFHGEDKHPSASLAKGFFKCFTCGKGPIDAITWLMEVEGYSFPAAVKRLVGI